jgi:REP element-mobilizing transposase RayT
MAFYRRNLPHWTPDGKAFFITWRLYGSLPRAVVPRRTTSRNRDGAFSGKDFVMVDRYLDSAPTGPRWLADPEVASAVEQTIFNGVELGHYLLDAYVIMPNHVHVLLWPLVSLARITGGTKGVSAKDANARLGRVGNHFWQDESFDHWVRNSRESERITHYIGWNPVKVGLASKPENWRWSSANPEVRKRMAELAQKIA